MRDLTDLDGVPELDPGSFYRIKYGGFGSYDLQLRRRCRFGSRVLAEVAYYPRTYPCREDGSEYPVEEALAERARTVVERWEERLRLAGLHRGVEDFIGDHPQERAA